MNLNLLGLVLVSVLVLSESKAFQKRYATGIPPLPSSGKRWYDYDYGVPETVYVYQENKPVPESVGQSNFFV